ncbi:conserved hypothetical protein [Ferrimonas balearica DSM 9799]|uniref:Outer membrane cytochrome MtrC/MtrF-like domain-containing protein n=1 Tax=Ferrimonas balearica (strain DSM 9799 / CCM 4581 / KCTC 23876 / PAT) TaxID=550540 RepID=E1SR88_FERBD|nr:cytochrome c3 family protein [Ferrimonas balearica]ADN74853.1 conserved hypothetical protein [Ferrimonas balearica DSM 9799]
MKQFRKPHLALLVAAAMAVAGCADDGKDGAPGEPGEPGPPGPGTPPPTVDVTETTHVKVLNFAVEEGQVVYEIEVTDQEGTLVEGLEAAEGKFAAWTERGYVLSRSGEGTLGGYGSMSTEGATLEMGEPGQYTFTLPMENVTAGQEGMLWLRVGDREGPIMRSMPLVVDKPEGTYSTSDATCNACHVDYAAGSRRHASYTAMDIEGEGDLVGGCLVCHNSVSRADENGGYATNTLSKIAHVNHPEKGFERDFTVLNCTTCHETTPLNTSIAGPGCVDCHNPGAPVGPMSPNTDPSFDIRAIHAQKVALPEIEQIRESHYTTTSAPYWDADVTWDSGTGAVCTDLKLFKVEGETETQLNIGDMYAAGELTYAGAYIHGYDGQGITGRAIARGSDQYVARADGTRSICFPQLLAVEGSDGTDFTAGNFMASTRVTVPQTGWVNDDGKDGVSFTTYSVVVSTDYFDVDPAVTAPTFTEVSDFDRRQVVAADSCVTCHNSETNYHKNGSYQNGGWDCVACHNNGQNRNSGGSAPGFGPMVHSMHWGVGSGIGTDDANSATKLNAENCVACHADGIDLYAIPNQYQLARAYHEGTRGMMASPVTANCFACHDSESALNHMVQNGGEIDAVADPLWYTTKSAESCATCHAEGKTFGIEKYHVFER